VTDQEPLDPALSWDSLPVDADVKRLLSAIQRIGTAAADQSALCQLLIEMAAWVVGADGAGIEHVDGDELVVSHGCGVMAASVGARVPREQSLAGWAVATSRPQLSADISHDERVNHLIGRAVGARSIVVVPMRRTHDVTTALSVISTTRNALSARDAAVLQPLVTVAAARLEDLAVFTQRVAADKMLAQLGQASRAILVADDPAAELCRWSARLIDSPLSRFLHPDDDGNLVTVAQHEAASARVELPLDESSIMRSAFDSGRVQLNADYRCAALPVTSAGHSVGVLALALKERITAADAGLLGLVAVLATEAGLAIERDELRRQLEAQARTDDLTGVANRRVWLERLTLEMARAGRNRTPLCLAILDLDHFKDFNDQHGHLAGDEALRRTAEALGAHIRETDLLARLGGEEFAILFPETDSDGAQIIGQRLLAALPGDITASCGLAQWDGEDADALYRRADEALYAAKAGGRNRLAIARPGDD